MNNEYSVCLLHTPLLAKSLTLPFTVLSLPHGEKVTVNFIESFSNTALQKPKVRIFANKGTTVASGHSHLWIHHLLSGLDRTQGKSHIEKLIHLQPATILFIKFFLKFHIFSCFYLFCYSLRLCKICPLVPSSHL